MSHEVAILWFRNADTNSRNDYHWSLFVCPVKTTYGTKYDALASTNVANVTEWNYSHLPGYNKQKSALLGGAIELGYINGEELLKSLMLSTPLPKGGENCQNWVSNVVQEAVRQRILPSSATQALRTIPTRP